MWIISFNPNDCVKESKICIRILHIGELRLKECKWVTQGLAVYYVVKPTQIQVVYLPGYGSFQYTTLQSSVKFYFPRVVLPFSVSISETEVN